MGTADELNEHSKLVKTHQTALSSGSVDPRPEEVEQSGFARGRPPHLEQATREVSVTLALLI